jgi:2-polyprenyl-3-methyl-5-hydroxy-6-metoxy-1,4-benzoquinol methylase
LTTPQQVSRWYDDFSRGVVARELEQPNLRLLAVQDLIRRHVAPGHRVLEVGCGVGILTRFLHERGCSVHSLDISPRNI